MKNMKRYLIEHDIDLTNGDPVLCNFDYPLYKEFKNHIITGVPLSSPVLDFFYFDKKKWDLDSFNITPLSGILISSRLFELFQKENVKGFQYYPCTIKDKDGGKTSNYYFMKSIVDFTNRIDYKRSDFVFKKSGILKTIISELPDNSNFEAIKIADKENNDPFTEILPREKFHFLHNELEEYKIININYFAQFKFYVTELLKTKMEGLPVNGIQFIETKLL